MPQTKRQPRPELVVAPESHATPEVLARMECLKRVKLFADLEPFPGSMEKIAKIMEERKFESGQSIIKEGEIGTEMYILLDGQASVFKSTSLGDLYKVAILNGKDFVFFGEGAMLEADSRSASILADTTCHCLVLDRGRFLNFSQEHPDWALPILYRIAKSVMGRLKKMNLDLALLYNALVAEIRGHY